MTKTECPHCGNELKTPGRKFCGNCGKPLADDGTLVASSEELANLYERATTHGKTKQQEEEQLTELKKQRIERRKKIWLQALIPLYGLVIAYNIRKTDKDNTKDIQFFILMAVSMALLFGLTVGFWWEGTLGCGVLYVGLGYYIYDAIKKDRLLVDF